MACGMAWGEKERTHSTRGADGLAHAEDFVDDSVQVYRM
jgi:hypothetical protein